MIFRYLRYLIITSIFTVLGLFIVPFLYPFRVSIQKNKTPFFWWFLNDTEQNPKWMDIDYGIYGRFKHNLIGFYRQCAIRNPHWNLKLLLGPEKGTPTDIKGEMQMLSVDWDFRLTKTFATYKINGKKYFRMSMIKKIGFLYLHYQFGSSSYKYVVKIKTGLIKNK